MPHQMAVCSVIPNPHLPELFGIGFGSAYVLAATSDVCIEAFAGLLGIIRHLILDEIENPPVYCLDPVKIPICVVGLAQDALFPGQIEIAVVACQDNALCPMGENMIDKSILVKFPLWEPNTVK